MIKLYYPKFWTKRNLMSYLLWIPSKLYFFLSLIRKILIKPYKLDSIKVISVGNITVGGTGKTQLVIWLSKFLTKSHISCVVITKSYKASLKTAQIVDHNSDVKIVGDESVLIAKYAKVISAKKFYHAIDLIKELKPDVIIVDDGMQSPYFIKDINIVTIDGTRGFGNGFLIPSGPLREYPKQAFKKADIIVILEQLIDKNIQNTIYSYYKEITFQANVVPAVDNLIIKPKDNYIAFTGIGNPQRFFNTLKENNINILDYKVFPDHHKYTNKECIDLKNYARKLNAKLITTSKDYVKVNNKFNDLYEFKVELSIANDEKIKNMIMIKLANAKYL